MDLQELCETYERIIQISFFERSSKDEMLIDAIESKRGVIMVKYNQLKIKGETQTLTPEEQLQLEQYGEFIERTFAAEFRTMDTMEICDLINSSVRVNINYPASQIIEKTSISVAWKKIEDELKYDLDNKIYVHVGGGGTGTYTPQQIRLIKIFQAVTNIYNSVMQKKVSGKLSPEEEIILSECENINRKESEIRVKILSTARLEMLKNNMENEEVLPATSKLFLECVINELNERHHVK